MLSQGIVPSGTSMWCAAAIIRVLTALSHQWALSIIGISRPLPAPNHRIEVD